MPFSSTGGVCAQTSKQGFFLKLKGKKRKESTLLFRRNLNYTFMPPQKEITYSQLLFSPLKLVRLVKNYFIF